MTQEHPYAEILRAIADGKEIEVNTAYNVSDIQHSKWILADVYTVALAITKGCWDGPAYFRVKPPKVYSTTSYTGEELYKIWRSQVSSAGYELAFQAVANAAIKRYIDEQEVQDV